MFWKKKKTKPSDKASLGQGGVSQAAPSRREQIIAQAKANAAAARAEIGDETLEKIKQAMLKKQASAIEKAKAQIKSMDHDVVRDHVQLWMRDKDKP